MGLFGKKEPKICGICGKESVGMESTHKAEDGRICHECFLKTGGFIWGTPIAIIKKNIKDWAYLRENNAVEMDYIQGLPSSIMSLGSVSENEEEIIVKAMGQSINRPDNACIFNTYRIPIDRVLSIDLITQENIKEKNKSVIGRGIVGGMLFGEVGAILGGMSGIGTKVEVTNTVLFVIAYTNAEGEIENIIFNPTKNLFKAEQFVLRFKQSRETEKVYQTNETGDILL